MKVPAVIALSILVSISSTISKDVEEQRESREELEVRHLLSSMEAGKFASRSVLGLTRHHIPSLLAFAENKTLAKSFPSNPISSFAQRKCTTGMVALWIVEGIRKQGGGKFSCPSLNPMCFMRGDTKRGKDWEEASMRNQDDVAAAYVKWWKRVVSPGSADAFKSDPLAGTELNWH